MLKNSKTDFARYLKLLGVREKEPSPVALEEIIKAQMFNVPFENISKLYYLKMIKLKGIPDFEQFLSGTEKYHFGGTCYAINYYLNRLLKYLGYEVKLCAADMSKPDVHIANIVTLENKEYIVDAGYGAPFLVPVPRYLQTDYVIESGENKYIFKPQDKEGRSYLELYKKGIIKHGYLLKPKSRSIDEFTGVIEESFNPGATFMNAILLTKFSNECSYIIHNMNYIEIKASSVFQKPIYTKEELAGLINKIFRIPTEILTHVLTDLSMNQEAWD